jgi:hypothetical protein
MSDDPTRPGGPQPPAAPPPGPPPAAPPPGGYGAPPPGGYGPPPPVYGPPPGYPPPGGGRGNGLIIAIVVGVVALAGIGAALFFLLGGDDDGPQANGQTGPVVTGPTATPTGPTGTPTGPTGTPTGPTGTPTGPTGPTGNVPPVQNATLADLFLSQVGAYSLQGIAPEPELIARGAADAATGVYLRSDGVEVDVTLAAFPTAQRANSFWEDFANSLAANGVAVFDQRVLNGPDGQPVGNIVFARGTGGNGILWTNVNLFAFAVGPRGGDFATEFFRAAPYGLARG